MRDWKELQKELQSEMKPKRYEHTLGVRYTAAALAMVHDCDLEQAQLAGLLHDCAKGYDDQKMLCLCEQYHLELSEAEQKNFSLLHAKVGAKVARDKYLIEDEMVLQAIRYHTTGRKEMSKLEQIIFLADYIEPNRKMLPGLPLCRKLAFEDLDLAMYQVLKNVLEYLQTKG